MSFQWNVSQVLTAENKHSFKFDEAKILVNERNKTKLQIHEVNQIIKFESNACNDKTDKKDYTNTYFNLIKMII